MKLIIIILCLVVLTGCNTQRCIFSSNPKLIGNMDYQEEVQLLRVENYKLRTEIDRLKNKLSKIKTLYKLDTILNEENYEK